MAKKQRMKYTDEELAAMKINAMLSGVDPYTITNEIIDDEDDIEIEIEDEAPKKKSKKAVKKDEPIVYEERVIDVRPEFKNIKKNFVFSVIYNEHVIHYKEQRWPIGTRVVEYNVKLITNPQLVKTCVEEITKGAEKAVERAYKGIDRYYRIETYDNVKNNCRYLGYIRLYKNSDGKLRTSLFTNSKFLESIHVNVDKFNSDIKNIMIDMVK